MGLRWGLCAWFEYQTYSNLRAIPTAQRADHARQKLCHVWARGHLGWLGQSSPRRGATRAAVSPLAEPSMHGALELGYGLSFCLA